MVRLADSLVLKSAAAVLAVSSVTCFTPIILPQHHGLSSSPQLPVAAFGLSSKNSRPLFSSSAPYNFFSSGDDHADDHHTADSSSSSSSPAEHHQRRGRGISSSELRKMNQVRRRRLEEERARSSRYLSGDDLHELRKEVLRLHEDLKAARDSHDLLAVAEVERTILKAQQLDAEFMYQVASERMEAAQLAGLHDEARVHCKQAMDARLALPQFNLQGLWVGKYGEHGFEMINVTYVGDTLVARKVTGDRTVPKGEMSFSVNLSPSSSSTPPTISGPPPSDVYAELEGIDTTPSVEPIELGPEAAQQWGAKYLQRFTGQGQVASEGFSDSEWLEGQLILVGQDYFSFAWLPIGHQVFFGRPSPELTLKLLRQSRDYSTKSVVPEMSTAADPSTPAPAANEQVIVDSHSDSQTAREHLKRCLEETELLEEEAEANGGVFRSDHQLDYYSQEGCFE